MNHPASNVLDILAQNGHGQLSFGDSKHRAKLRARGNATHGANFCADEEVLESIDTGRFCA
jgi:hypothetical protein